MRTWIATLTCLCLLLLSRHVPAQNLWAGNVVTTEQVRAELLVHAPQGVKPGGTVWAGLQLDHAPGWHSYWKNAGDSGLPTELHWSLPAGVQAGEIAWPTPRKFPLGDLANYGYDGKVLLPVPLTVDRQFKGTTLEMAVHAQWLVCRVECLPQEGRFTLRLPTDSSNVLNGEAFEAAKASVPRAGKAGLGFAKAGPKQLQIQLKGLPKGWEGQTLEIFLETTGLIAPGKAWSQTWENGLWTAELPYSDYRTEAPDKLTLVLTLKDKAGVPGWRVELPVKGAWPVPSTPGPLAQKDALQPALNTPPRVAPSTDSGTPDGNMALWAAMVGAFLGGLILNLMPCVFPVLALKVLAFARHAKDQRSNRLSGLAYTLGVVMSFMVLGGILMGLRSAGEQLGWGFQLQDPAVVAGLAVLFTLIGLNLAGLFDVGHWAPGRVAALQLRHPAADAALTGVLAVAIASPCTAPFMGASLGLAIGLPVPQAMAVFASLGLGMSLPYLLASWYPALTRALPRPGPWMVTLRQLLAFPMLGTVVWLLWVLGQQNGVNATAILLSWLLGMALWLWSLGRSGRIWPAISVLLLALLGGTAWQKGPDMLRPEPQAGTARTQTEVTADGRWHAWTPELANELQKAGTPFLVDYTAAWCVTCQYNKATTLADLALLTELASKGVVLLRADWTRRDAAVTKALAELNRNGVPTYALHPRQGPARLLSEIPSAAEIRLALATI